MGTCNHQKPLSITVDLTLIDSLHPILSLSLPGSQSPRDLFRLIRHQLPIAAPADSFQFSLNSRLIRMTSQSLHSLRVKNEDRLVLEFLEGKEMTQINVQIEGGQERFSVWVQQHATVESLLTQVSKKVRLPYEALSLVQDSKKLEDSDVLEPLTDSTSLSVRLAEQTMRMGLEVVVACDNSACGAYLQRRQLAVGLGSFEYPKVLVERNVQCAACGKGIERAELLQFRECEVRFEGLLEDGSEEHGSEVFSYICGELLQGRRLPWRRLLLEVLSLPSS